MSLTNNKPETLERSFAFRMIKDEDEAAELYKILGDGRYVQVPVAVEAHPRTFQPYVLVVAAPGSEDIGQTLFFKIDVTLAQKVGLITANNRFISFLSSESRFRLNKDQESHLNRILDGFTKPINVTEVGGLIGVLHDPLPAAEGVNATEATPASDA